MAGAWQRRAATWFGRRLFTLRGARPTVSFTFDDFPRSALIAGGAALERFGLAGTYYTSLGLAGQTTACGQMFTRDDLPELLTRGHELGCHTFDHCPAWETSPDNFADSVLHNRQALRSRALGARFSSLSYPISYPRPETKRRVARYFPCCRGGGQRFNTGTVDLNYLSAFFLEQTHGDLDAVKRILVANQAAGGWLIFATHEVTDHPSRFGCTPAFFEQVVRLAIDMGADILPVGQAFKAWRTHVK
jgi:peptidoglycan/xylan/chitin deacetylase (PgdA/CDA1 family)